MKTRYLYWILLAFVSSPLEPVNAQHKRLEITRTPPISSPGWYDWIYAPGITPAARNELEPLYQQLDVLLRNRLPVAAQEAQDLAWDLLAAAGAEMNSNTPDAVRQSATGRASPKHAATSADSPEAPVSNMLSAILTCERQIKSVRHKHNLDTIIGPANKDVDVSAFFTQDALKRWFAKAGVPVHLDQAAPRRGDDCRALHDVGMHRANEAVKQCNANFQACHRACDVDTTCMKACPNCDAEFHAFDHAANAYYACVQNSKGR